MLRNRLQSRWKCQPQLVEQGLWYKLENCWSFQTKSDGACGKLNLNNMCQNEYEVGRLYFIEKFVLSACLSAMSVCHTVALLLLMLWTYGHGWPIHVFIRPVVSCTKDTRNRVLRLYLKKRLRDRFAKRRKEKNMI